MLDSELTRAWGGVATNQELATLGNAEIFTQWLNMINGFTEGIFCHAIKAQNPEGGMLTHTPVCTLID